MRPPPSDSVMDDDPRRFQALAITNRRKSVVDQDPIRRKVHFSPLRPTKCLGTTKRATEQEFSWPKYSPRQMETMYSAESGYLDNDGQDAEFPHDTSRHKERRESRLSVYNTRSRGRSIDNASEDDEESDRNDPWTWPKKRIIHDFGNSEERDVAGVKNVVTPRQIKLLRSVVCTPKYLIEPPSREPQRTIKRSDQKRIQSIQKAPAMIEKKDVGDPWKFPRIDSKKSQKRQTSHQSAKEKRNASNKEEGLNTSKHVTHQTVNQKQEQNQMTVNLQRAQDCLPSLNEGEYHYSASTGVVRPLSGLNQTSPSFNDKFHKWEMEPRSSPPIAPEKHNSIERGSKLSEARDKCPPRISAVRTSLPAGSMLGVWGGPAVSAGTQLIGIPCAHTSVHGPDRNTLKHNRTRRSGSGGSGHSGSKAATASLPHGSEPAPDKLPSKGSRTNKSRRSVHETSQASLHDDDVRQPLSPRNHALKRGSTGSYRKPTVEDDPADAWTGVAGAGGILSGVDCGVDRAKSTSFTKEKSKSSNSRNEEACAHDTWSKGKEQSERSHRSGYGPAVVAKRPSRYSSASGIPRYGPYDWAEDVPPARTSSQRTKSHCSYEAHDRGIWD